MGTHVIEIPQDLWSIYQEIEFPDHGWRVEDAVAVVMFLRFGEQDVMSRRYTPETDKAVWDRWRPYHDDHDVIKDDFMVHVADRFRVVLAGF